MWWVVIGCAADLDDVLQREPDLERGAEVFAEVCADCHGADGTGGRGTNLANDDNSFEEIAERVLFGWGEMEPLQGALTAQQVADVSAYVEQLVQR